jgi:hypothetical protein
MRTLASWNAAALAIVLPSQALAQTPDPGSALPAAAPAPSPEPSTSPNPRGSPSDGTPRHDGLYVRVSSGIGFMSVWGDGPAGSASISGLESVGVLAVGGSPVSGFVVAGTLWGTSISNTFNGGPFGGKIIIPNPTSGPPPSSPPTPPAASTNAAASLGGVGVLVDWFPNPAGGWHAGASVGLGATQVTTLADNSNMSGLGVGAFAFGGYDGWIGRNWSVGAMLVAAGANQASLTDSNRKDTGYHLMPLSIGIAASVLYY